MGDQQLLQSFCRTLATSAMLGVLIMLVQGSAVEGRRLGETCDRGRAMGDKWFDGCKWCVCGPHGVHCSRSDCSGLVEKVPPCHEVGERWNDGCYRCKCRRHGITCRLDSTCLLLRHHPVPCLADHRCVCGPDGVPSCTAEVIDRHAFSAHRVDLGLPMYLAPDGRHEYPEFHHDDPDSNEIERKVEEALNGGEDSASQELLIMSDNMCRFGPRWYGGSLRCYCDIDGSITCGNPIFVTAFIDNFSVLRQECEEGHVWEEGCSVCSCRTNGVTFCRRSRDCRHDFLGGDDDDDDDFSDFDHVLPVDSNTPSVIPEPTSPFVPPADPTSAYVPKTMSTRRPALECIPGTRWQEGCVHCRCTHFGRSKCTKRLCKDKSKAKEKQESNRHTTHAVTHANDNHVKEPDVTVPSLPRWPRGPRGPIMVPPRPPGTYRPPAYSVPPNFHSGCGKFSVGQKYWQECNLCLCTKTGPKCEAKLCR